MPLAASKKDDPESMLRAVAHPTRLAVLRSCDGKACSPSEIASELPDATVQRVVHHIQLLLRVGLIERTGSETVKGTALVRTLYRSDGWAEKVRPFLPPELLTED